MAFADVVRFTATSSGTGDFVVSSAVTGYQTPALAGATDGTTYKYRAESVDLSQWEVGVGTYATGTTTLARTTVLYNSSGTGTASGQSGAGSKISFSAAPQVAFVPLKGDLESFAPVGSQYITAASDSTLTAERVATDTDAIAWDFGTSGQAKARFAITSIVQQTLTRMGAARALAVAQFGGMAFADSFGATTYVDVAGATNLDTSTTGSLKPTSSSESSAAQTGTGNSGTTVIDRSWAVNNSATVYSIGAYSSSAQTVTVKILKYNSPGNYDVVVSESFSHGGAGWQDFTLSSSYSVPGSGSYYAGVYAAGTVGINSGSVARSYVASNVTGTGQSLTEDTGNPSVVRVSYGFDALTVASSSIAVPAEPTMVVPIIRIKHNASATAGTDYNITVSRDGGSTYSSNATLTDYFTDPSDSAHVVYGAAVDVSGQPSGSNVRIKLTTGSNKNVEAVDWGFAAY
jgi:hypothetical protein